MRRGDAIEAVGDAGPTMTPASPAQRRMWFLHELDGAAGYNVSVAFRLTGRLDHRALEQALCDIVERHEMLRTVFREIDGELFQSVLAAPSNRPALPVLAVDPAAVEPAMHAAAGSRFDLAREIPVRAQLLATGPDRHVLALVVHHIAVDEWSMYLIMRDFSTAYAARRVGTAPSWSGPAPTYADYVTWQRRALGSEDDPGSRLSADLAFWRRAMAGAPDPMPLTADRPPPAEPSHRGGWVRFEIPPQVHEELAQLGAVTGASMFMQTAAVLAALLTRLGCGTDITIGTPITGRVRRSFEEIVGFLTNTVVLRIDTSGEPTFRELFIRTRDAALGAYGHSAAPFDRVVAALGPDLARQANPLFRVMLVLQKKLGEPNLTLPGLTVERLPVQTELSRQDLTVYVTELQGPDGGPDGMRMAINYAVDLFDEATVARMGRYLLALLTAAAADPDRSPDTTDLGAPPGIPPARPDVPPSVEAAETTDVVEVFERQAIEIPYAPAVMSRHGSLSYAALDSRAGRLADRMLGMGIGPESIVALALPRTPEIVVAMFAALKAGAAYLPIDTDYPLARMRYILADARPACVVSTRALAAELEYPDAPWILVDDPSVAIDLARPGEAGSPARRHPVRPTTAAYVIYTSGSTGQPKGVVVERAALAGYVEWCRTAYRRLRGHTVVHSSFSFDFTVTQVYGALTLGGCVHLAPLDEEELAAAGVRTIDFLKVTPSHLPLLSLLSPSTVATTELMFGGEALSADALRPLREAHPTLDVINHFGPTEATVGCLEFRLPAGEPLPDGPVPIGRPMPDVCAYILDARLRPVPPGVIGELFVSGSGIARGYLNRPALTAERFVPDPFSPAHARMYRTGDLVRQRDDGTVVFVGRADDQVKIRGHRVELGEVERALRGLPGVSQAAAVARSEPDGATRLGGYVTLTSCGDGNGAAFRALLAATLPDYMVPATITVLDALPLTPHGKVDRHRLALMRPRAGQQPVGGGLTNVVCKTFATVLGVAEVTAQSDFFDLGGDSISAVRLVRELRARLGLEVPLRWVLGARTPAALAEALSRGGPGADRPGRQAPGAAPSPPAVPSRTVAGAPPAPPVATGWPPDDIAHVLLTGATGFFGAFTLVELLTRTRASVHCLVRAEDASEARRRLRGTLRNYGRDPDDWPGRVHVLVGDLEQPHLGLLADEFARLSRMVDVILHCGANVNAVLPLDRLRQCNVGGTAELARLARTDRPKALHFASTTSVMATTAPTGYARSKQEAEEFVIAEQRAGLAATIGRLPRLSADSTTGHHNHRDLMHHAVVTMLEDGVAPDVDIEEVWLPVDRAARAYVETSLSAPSGGRFVYTSTERFSLRQCLRQALEQGFDLRIVPYPKWEQAAIRDGRPEHEFAVATIRAGLRRAAAGPPATHPTQDPFVPVLVPGVDPEILGTWLSRLAGTTRPIGNFNHG